MWAHKSISGFKLCTCGQTTGIDPISVLWGANGSYSPKQQAHLKRGVVATAKVVSEMESIWLQKSKERHWTTKPLCCFTLLSCYVAQQHYTDMDTWLFHVWTDRPAFILRRTHISLLSDYEANFNLKSYVVPQGSAGFPSVLDSSEISTENGRTSRFPRPELEISFSPLQPNRMALRRQGEENAVTVKITRSARKRKSGEMEKVRTNQTKSSFSTHSPGVETVFISKLGKLKVINQANSLVLWFKLWSHFNNLRS